MESRYGFSRISQYFGCFHSDVDTVADDFLLFRVLEPKFLVESQGTNRVDTHLFCQTKHLTNEKPHQLVKQRGNMRIFFEMIQFVCNNHLIFWLDVVIKRIKQPSQNNRYIFRLFSQVDRSPRYCGITVEFVPRHQHQAKVFNSRVHTKEIIHLLA